MRKNRRSDIENIAAGVMWSMRTNRRSHILMIAAGACVALGALRPAAAQSAPRRGAGATLPESNEAMLLTSRAEDAISRADFRLALQLIEQITTLGDELVADPSGDAYYPVWRQAQRLLAKLPAEGLAFFRQAYDAEVEARAKEALARGDLNVLRALLRAYPVATPAERLQRELAARLMDSGRFHDAIDVFYEAADLPGTPNDAFDRQAQLMVALAESGSFAAAAQSLRALERMSEGAGMQRRSDRVARLRTWYAGLCEASRSSHTSVSLSPLLAGRRLWTRRIAPERERDALDDDQTVAAAVQDRRRLPLVEPVYADGALVVRMRGQVHVFDALTLTRRWSAAEIGSSQPEWTRPRVRFGAGDSDPSDDELSADARHLLWHWLRHAVTVGFGAVYTVEVLTPLNDDSLGLQQRARFVPDAETPPTPNQLVARRLSNGENLWRIGTDDAHPLSGCVFQDRPIAVGSSLAVPVQKGQEIHLCILKPETGELERELAIAGPPTKLPPEAGRCQLATDGASVFVCTGNGVIASISAATWDWRWATEYPTLLAGERMRRAIPWRYELTLPTIPGASRPIVAADLLVVSPIDSEHVLALDRYTGRIRWTTDRGDVMTVVGALDDGLIMAGGRLVRVALADGKTVQWRSIPIELSGRPEISGQRVYVPVRTGMLVFDGRTGKIVDENESPGVSVGNLVATRDAVCRVGPNEIVKHPDVAAVQAWSREALAANAKDARPRLAGAWLDTLEGRYEAALASIAGLQSDDPSIAVDRDAMLAALVTHIARGSAPPAEKLAMLKAAEAAAASPAAASRLSVVIAHMLEGGAEWREGLRRYESILLAPDSPMLDADTLLSQRSGSDFAIDAAAERSAAEREAGYKLSGWLHAARRIRALLSSRPPAEQTEWLYGVVARRRDRLAPATTMPATGDAATPPDLRRLADLDAGHLARLYAAAPDGIASETVSAALLLSPLAPELLARHVGPVAQVTDDAGLRRSLHLARWSVHLSLGEIAAAADDAAEWNRLWFPTSGPAPTDASGEAIAPPASGPAGGGLTSEQRDALAFVERITRKLKRAADPEFTPEFSKRWTVPEGSLVLDRSRPYEAERATILVQQRGTRKLELRRMNLGASLRETTAGTMGGSPAAMREESFEAAEEFLGALRGDMDGMRAPIPALVYGALAVVPVRGGLVCVGLGPEGRAGNRLWDYAINESFDVFDEFAERVVAGPHGVYAATRPDRIVALDWHDGKPRWRREFDPAKLEIRRLDVYGGVVVAIGRDGQIATLSEEYGDDARWLADEMLAGMQHVATCPARPAAGPTPAEGVIVLAAGAELRAFKVGTGAGSETAWTRRLKSNVLALTAIRNLGWIAVREDGGGGWRFLDAASGNDAAPFRVADDGAITAAAVADTTLLVACFSPEEAHEGEMAERRRRGGDGAAGQAFVAAFDLAEGVPRWSHRIDTGAPINLTQLTAHRDWLPLLLVGESASEMDATPGIRRAAIQLLDKRTGEVAKNVTLDIAPRQVVSPGAVYLLATPTRLIVQLGTTITAYGNSLLGGGN